ncbi:MAG: YihY/virulence factor BrkB family protein [Ignavibacteria bacterium]|nr:YihY/virulence factor BrkB family protein [Ignavibacteria bacterium]
MKTKLLHFIQKPYSLVANFIDNLDRHHIFLLSAAIAFNILLYIIPLILVGIYLATLFIDKNSFMELISNLLFSFLPETEGSYYFVSNLLLEINKIFNVSNFAGWIGIFILIWISSTVFSSLRNSLNVVFGVQANKLFVIYKLKDILLTLVLTVLILILAFALPLVTIINKAFFQILPETISKILSQLTTQIIWITLYFIFFFFIYKFIPSSNIPFKIVIISSLICTLLSELARVGFTIYLKYFANYSKFYGTYGLLVSILFWIYYLFFIILFSAELTLYLFPKFYKRENVSDKI